MVNGATKIYERLIFCGYSSKYHEQINVGWYTFFSNPTPQTIDPRHKSRSNIDIKDDKGKGNACQCDDWGCGNNGLQLHDTKFKDFAKTKLCCMSRTKK